MPKSRVRKDRKSKRAPTPRRKPNIETRLAFAAVSDSGDTVDIDNVIEDIKEQFVAKLGDKLHGEMRSRVVLAAEAMTKMDELGAWDDPIQKERIRFFLERNPSGALVIVFGDCLVE